METFTIHITQRERLVALARGLVAAVLGMLVIARTLAIAFEWERYAQGEAQLVERWVFFFSGLVIGMVPLPLSIPLTRPALVRRAHISLHEDWATIRRDGLLPEPFVFQHRDLRGVMTGDLAPLKRGHGWLYPLLAASSVRPNLALVFHGTVAGMGPVRTIKRWPQGGASYLSVPGRKTSGLLLRVDDPEAAAAALRRWASLADVDPGDLEPVKPTDYEWGSRRFAVYLGYAVLILLAALHLGNVIANPLPDACDAMRFSCAPGD